MKKTIYILSILCVIMLMGSCATKKIYQSDLVQTSSRDSTDTYEVLIDSGSYADRYIHVYDSVITHVTIFRYDTMISTSGDPVIKEMIQIDQTKIKKHDDLTQSGDTTKVISHAETEVSRNDSIHQNITMAKETNDKSSILWIIIIILILVITIEICAIGWNVFRNK